MRGMNENFQSKLVRKDGNYQKVKEYGCADDAVALERIKEELASRACIRCERLEERITQLEAVNKELAKEVNALYKKNKWCPLFW